MKTLTVKLDDEDHIKLKMFAISQGATMQDMVEEQIQKLIIRNEKPVARKVKSR